MQEANGDLGLRFLLVHYWKYCFLFVLGAMMAVSSIYKGNRTSPCQSLFWKEVAFQYLVVGHKIGIMIAAYLLGQHGSSLGNFLNLHKNILMSLHDSLELSRRMILYRRNDT